MTATLITPQEKSPIAAQTTVDLHQIPNLAEIRQRFEESFSSQVADKKADMINSILRREFGHLAVATNADFQRRAIAALQEEEALIDKLGIDNLDHSETEDDSDNAEDLA